MIMNGKSITFHTSHNTSSDVTFYNDDTNTMSERVQSLADAVYKEFERLIKVYDENVVKDLMPLVVAILESLENSCREKQQMDVDAELLREDNDQLLTQYEKERQLRRIADQRYLVLEDSMDEERKQLQGRLESFESIIRMFEIKFKNSQDQVARMDEREQDMKKEFSKLHERYTDLLKSHMDFKERVKTFVNPQEGLDQSGLIIDFTLPRNFKFANQKQSRAEFSDSESSSSSSPPPVKHIKRMRDDDEEDDDEEEDDEAKKSINVEINNIAAHDEDTKNNLPKKLITIDDKLRRSLIGEMDKLHLTFCEEDGNYESHIRPNAYNELEHDDRSELALGEDVMTYEEQDIRHEDDIEDGCGDNDYSGVSKEIENLIMENNELLETKHALNIVKDDLIAKVDELTGEKEILKNELETALQSKERIKVRVSDLEDELRKMRTELEVERNKDSNYNHGDEDGLTPGQRKRFTRLEMARVLMERNQYKERLMELQEAVRWAEMVRAARDHPEFAGEGKKKSSLWNFFSNLFSSNKSSSSFVDQSTSGGASVYYTPNSEHNKSIGLNSILDRRRRDGDKNITSTPINALKSSSSPSKEEGRMVACGWSLPPKFQVNRTLNFDTGLSGLQQSSIPLPVFCKPLLEEDPNLKILCCASITGKGGQAPSGDGGNLNGENLFYSKYVEPVVTLSPSKVNIPIPGSKVDAKYDDEIEKLNKEIMNREKEIKEVNVGCGGNDPDPYHVWVCVDDRTGSHVIVVDAGDEGVVLEKFHVCLPNLHCIYGVPGTADDDYTNNTKPPSPCSSIQRQTSLLDHVTFVDLDNINGKTKDELRASKVMDENDRLLNLLPTVWMGNIAGSLYIYSAVPSSRKRLHIIKLCDSVMAICHLKGKVFVALANGTVVCFLRGSEGQWSVNSYYNIMLAPPTYAVRSAAVVAKKFLWCSVANDIYVLDPVTFAIDKKFNAHPQKENHVRHMAWMGDGVWVGFRNDSSLKLYHAYTHQYLQDVDVEPCISKFLGSSKLGFSLVQISCLMTSLDRLWVGTGNGVILSIPISESYEPGVLTSANVGMNETFTSTISNPVLIGGHKTPGGVVRVYGDKKNEEVYPGSFIPYCSVSQVQISFHGLKEAVKFLVSMPGGEKKIPPTKMGQKHAEIYRKYSLPLPTSNSLSLPSYDTFNNESSNHTNCIWVMCGGEGCTDFRLELSSAVDLVESLVEEIKLGDTGVHETVPKSDKSHIIMWQILVP